jgi:hypothetical protein
LSSFILKPTCENCARLERATAQMLEDQNHLLEDVAALEWKLKQSARGELALRRQLAEVREADPKSQKVREVLEYGVKVCGKRKNYKISAGTKRWENVAKMLKLGHTVDDLKQAYDGLAAMPWVGPKGRQSEETLGAQRHDDLELPMRDETFVARFQGYAQQAKRAELLARPLPERPIDRWLDALDAHGVRWRGAISALPEIAWESQCLLHLDPAYAVLAVHNYLGELEVVCSVGCSTEGLLSALGLEPRSLRKGAEFAWESARWRMPCLKKEEDTLPLGRAA